MFDLRVSHVALTLLTMILSPIDWAVAMNCEPLHPGITLRTDFATQANAAAETLYKVAEAGGAIEVRAREVIKGLSDKYPDVNQASIAKSLIYMKCEQLKTSTDMTSAEKHAVLDSFSEKILSSATPGPPAPTPAERAARLAELDTLKEKARRIEKELADIAAEQARARQLIALQQQQLDARQNILDRLLRARDEAKTEQERRAIQAQIDQQRSTNPGRRGIVELQQKIETLEDSAREKRGELDRTNSLITVWSR